MTLLSLDSITHADDRETREVDVPEWGGKVRLRALSGEEREQYEVSLQRRFVDPKTGSVTFEGVNRDTLAKLVAAGMVDEAGNRVVSPNNVSVLSQKSNAVLDRLYDIVAEMSGMTEKAKKDIEADFSPAPDDSSSSE